MCARPRNCVHLAGSEASAGEALAHAPDASSPGAFRASMLYSGDSVGSAHSRSRAPHPSARRVLLCSVAPPSFSCLVWLVRSSAA